MSQHQKEPEETGVTDEDLPADLVPDQDNPLAEGLPAGETVEGLREEGKRPEETAYAPAEGTGEEGERARGPAPEESAEPQESERNPNRED